MAKSPHTFLSHFSFSSLNWEQILYVVTALHQTLPLIIGALKGFEVYTQMAVVQFIVASAAPSTARPPTNSSSLSAALQRLQSVSQGWFCVLTLFILFLVKMWYSGFLSLGLGGYCGGAIGECGCPLGRPTKSCLHLSPLLATLSIWILQSHPVAELRLVAAVDW